MHVNFLLCIHSVERIEREEVGRTVTCVPTKPIYIAI